MESKSSPPTLKNPLQSHILPYVGVKDNFGIINGSYSNDLILLEDAENYNLSIKENQRLRSIIILNSQNVALSVLDSAVVYTRTIRLINCKDAKIAVIDADIRRIELWDCQNITITIMCDQVQFENVNILIHPNNENIKIEYSEVIRDYIKLVFKNEVINELNIPKIEDKDKIILVQCTKVPLFSANIYNIKDEFFQDKFSYIKYITKTLEFSTEEIN